MGCGCNKKRVSRKDRMKKQRLKVIQDKKKGLPIFKATMSLTSKSPICMSCPQSEQTINERKKGIRVCRKTNRLINNIIRDPRFICPVGKWQNPK